MKRNTYLAVACVLLVLAGGIYYFMKEEAFVPPKTNQEAKSDNSSNITFSGNTIIERNNGRKIWEITADSTEVNPETNEVKLINFKGVLYRDNGGRIDLTAKQAIFDSKTHDVHLEGDIKAVSSDGAVFTSVKARWGAQEKHIYGSDGICLTRGDTVITGDQIDSDDKFEKVKVQGNAHIVKGGVPQ